jgi:hypothetical protein
VDGTCRTYGRGEERGGEERRGEERRVYRVLIGKPEGKGPLGIQRCRWENRIRINLRETGWGSVEWIQMAQDRGQWKALVNTVMNLHALVSQS